MLLTPIRSAWILIPLAAVYSGITLHIRGVAYFCGYEHIYNMTQVIKDMGGKAWQILLDSGGSPFDSPTDTTVNPVTVRDHAWAKVKTTPAARIISSILFNFQ